MTMKLRSELRRRLSALNRIPYLNQGGCGLVAEELYKWLQYNHLQPKVVILEDHYPDHFEAAVRYNDTGYVCNGPSHVVLKIGSTFIDSTGFHKGNDFLYEWGEPINTPIELLEYWNLKPDYWNFRFDRHKYLKEIKTIIWQGTQLSLDI